MRIRRTVMAIAVSALFIGACGDDDAASDDTGLDRAEEQAVVDDAVLTLSDFPSGWTEQSADDDDDDENGEEEQERAIAECLGVDYDRLYGDDIDAESPTFISPADEELSNTAGLEQTEEDAIFVLETLASDDAGRCFAEQFETLMEQEDLGEGIEIGTVSFDQLSLRDLGDQSAGYRVTVPITANGTPLDLYLDLAVVRIGRGGVTVQAISTASPFDTAELERYAEIASDRLRAGLENAES